jgi:D-3-phosphoglycerate dehydrogenase
MSEQRFTVYRVGGGSRGAFDDERDALERVGARHVVIERTHGDDDLLEQAGDADGLIIVESPVSRQAMEKMGRLKVVLRTGVGVDVVDVDAATDLGIAVVYIPDLWIREVANHAMALMLACNRRLLLHDFRLRAGGWTPTALPVGSIHGETVGILGLGRIGSAFAARAAAFEMEVIAYDPYVSADVFARAGAESVSFDELLRRSDYISIHSPKTDETTHIIDEPALRRMKPSAYLINTSRGPVVDQPALVKALSEGWIAGAGIDVFEVEPPEENEPLLKMDNVIVTPHSAFYSDAAAQQVPGRCGEEIARVLTGRMPMNLYNPAVLDKLPLKAE